jgi:serine/threonine-protein kinase
LLVAAQAVWSRGASAQPVAHDTAAAEAAFAEARALIRQGQYAEACPKLEASFSLDPALGTLLNLSDCFERTGRTASAWVRYREAAAMAVQQNHREREAIARGRIAALEPQLCRLVIRTAPRPNLEVTRDGVVVDRAALGLPVPVDPGAHVITASAPGATAFTSRIDVRPPEKDAACVLTTIDIPAVLEGEQKTVASPAPIEGPPRGDQGPSSAWRTQHTLAVVAASAGVVALGVGTVFVLKASSTQSEADPECSSNGCSPEGKKLLADAGASADVATVTFIVGAALVATGAVLWLTSPSLRTSAAAMLRDPRGVALRF